jgi:Glycosyltransferase family 87
MWNYSQRDGLFLIAGVSIWIVTGAVICILVFLNPSHHTVTHVYHVATTNWIDHKNLFDNSTGMHYFPHFILLFAPFHFLPYPLGDMLWRAISVFLLAWGIFKFTGLLRKPGRPLFFFYATLLSITPSIGAIRNGQANVIFAAMTILSIVYLSSGRWGLAVVFLLVGFMIKPLGIVLMALAVLLYPEILWRLVSGLLVSIPLPFLFAERNYVSSQLIESLARLRSNAFTTEHRFADINGLLRTIGVGLSGNESLILRLLAALITALACVLFAGKRKEPDRSLLLYGIAATYLMLFNPMTEQNSYVIAAPIVSFYAVYYLKIKGNSLLGAGLAAMSISIGVLPEILRKVDGNFGLWWDPLMMILLILFLGYEGMLKRSPCA